MGRRGDQQVLLDGLLARTPWEIEAFHDVGDREVVVGRLESQRVGA